MLDVAIVGGGLAGLALAACLTDGHIDFGLFEANHHLGGRILTVTGAGDDPGARFDLGPTWVWPEDQLHLRRFLDRHDLDIFPQYQTGKMLYLTGRDQQPVSVPDPQAYAGAYRIQGGAMRLVEALLPAIYPARIRYQHRLTRVTNGDDHVELTFATTRGQDTVKARKVVLCLPPRLLAKRVEFFPVLDGQLVTLLATTPTWMAGHAKAIIQYERPFWRERGLSGNAFAQYPGAILGEIFDACDATGNVAALGGFFALPADLRQKYRDDLEPLVLEQLFQLFGVEATRPLAIHLTDWFQVAGTAVAEDASIPSTHPRYGHQWLRLDHWDEKLWFASTETDPNYGGYLEGALRAAMRMASELSPMVT